MGGGASSVSPAEVSILKTEILNLVEENEVYSSSCIYSDFHVGVLRIHNLLKRIDETSKQRNEAEKNPNFLNEPWRKIHETLTDVRQLKESFMNNMRWTEPETPLNILLLGQAGSGKSSFVNACFTALLQEGRVVKRAVDGALGSESITEGEYKGVQTGDIEKICRGHIKDGYLIDPKEGIKSGDKTYPQHPQEKDKIHCVVYVLAADEVGFAQDEVLDQFNTITRMFRKGRCIMKTIIFILAGSKIPAKTSYQDILKYFGYNNYKLLVKSLDNAVF